MNKFGINNIIFDTATSGNKTKLKELIRSGVGIGHKDSLKWLLKYCMYNNWLDILKEVLKHGVDPYFFGEWCFYPDKYTFSFPIKEVVCAGHTDIIEELIDHGLHLERRLGKSLIKDCARFGHLGLFKKLIEHGIDPHISDNYCFCYGTPEIIKYLKSINK